MPQTIRANIQRKLQQSDKCIKRSIAHLADVWLTVDDQHPDIGGELMATMTILDAYRQVLRRFYEEHWGPTAVYMWQSTDLTQALDSAKIIWDPKYKDKRQG